MTEMHEFWKDLTPNYLRTVTSFLCCYLDYKQEAFEPDGILRASVIRQSLLLLLENKVFDDYNEMQQMAIRAACITLPLVMIEGEKNE